MVKQSLFEATQSVLKKRQEKKDKEQKAKPFGDFMSAKDAMTRQKKIEDFVNDAAINESYKIARENNPTTFEKQHYKYSPYFLVYHQRIEAS